MVSSANEGMKNLQGIIIIIIDLVLTNNNKETCRLMDFAVPTEHRVNMDEREKLISMRVTVMPIIVDAHGTVAKDFEKRLEEWKIR